MKTKIFYFTGTGNSLQIARDLAERLGDTQLVSIAKETNHNITITDKRVGFIFPTFYTGIPRIVRKFIETLNLEKNQYVFAVVTCGNTSGGTLMQVDSLLKDKGCMLAAGFSVRQPGSSIILVNSQPVDLQTNRLSDGKNRVREIVSIIKDEKKGIIDKNPMLVNFIGNVINKNFIRNLPASDKNFWTMDKCNNCGICERICPTLNITVVNGKHIWNGNCEQCMACIQWCPTEAIQYKKSTVKRKRYHNPKINANDLFQY